VRRSVNVFPVTAPIEGADKIIDRTSAH